MFYLKVITLQHPKSFIVPSSLISNKLLYQEPPKQYKYIGIKIYIAYIINIFFIAYHIFKKNLLYL